MSPTGVSSAEKIFDDALPVGPRTALAPEWVCKEYVARLDAEISITPDARALAMVGMLLGQLPSVNAHNTKVYQSTLGALFAAYPEAIGRKALDPVNGLAAKCEFTPKPSDLKKFLDAEMMRRDTRRANALSHLEERKRREASEREKAEDMKSSSTFEERRAAVQRLLGRAIA